MKRYAAEGVGAMLMGESLMQATDPVVFHLPAPSACLLQETHWHTMPPLVKICGIRSKEEAVARAEAGVDLLGFDVCGEPEEAYRFGYHRLFVHGASPDLLLPPLWTWTP